MAETQWWQALPTQLERAEFEQFVLQHLSSPKFGFSYAKVRKVPRPGAAAQGCFRSFRMRSGGKYR